MRGEERYFVFVERGEEKGGPEDMI